MNLQEFVSASLQQIVLGVKDAQKALEGSGGLVSPRLRRTSSQDSVGEPDMRGGQPVFPVEFDVAITTTALAGGRHELSVETSVAADVAGQHKSATHSNLSRIKFRAPVCLPDSV